MSNLYAVVNMADWVVGSFPSKEEAIEFAKKDGAVKGYHRYVYKLVADVVIETKTVTEVIDHG